MSNREARCARGRRVTSCVSGPPVPPPRRPLAQRSGKMAAGGAGAAAEPGWDVAVRPLLSASYSAFEMKELPQLLASVIER